MIEIMVGVFLGSFCLSTLLSVWNFVAVSRLLKSKSLKIVNGNLEKVGMFWSMNADNFKKLEEGAVEKDGKRLVRSTLMLACLSLFSLFGFVLLLILTVSMRVLRTDRKTKALFQSALAKQTELSEGAVRDLVTEVSRAG